MRFKQISAIIGTVLLVVGLLGLLTRPEIMPGWWQRAWGMTFPYNPHGTAKELAHPAVKGQIWTGNGAKGVGGETTLDFDKPATRENAADADARVDGRSQYRGYASAMVSLGLLLLFLSGARWIIRRIVRSEGVTAGATATTTAAGTGLPGNPVTQSDQTAMAQNEASRLGFRDRLHTLFFGQSRTVYIQVPPTDKVQVAAINTCTCGHQCPRTCGGSCSGCCAGCGCRCTCACLSTERVSLTISVESLDGDEALKARHIIKGDLPPMHVGDVYAKLVIGSKDTVQEATLEVK